MKVATRTLMFVYLHSLSLCIEKKEEKDHNGDKSSETEQTYQPNVSVGNTATSYATTRGHVESLVLVDSIRTKSTSHQMHNLTFHDVVMKLSPTTETVTKHSSTTAAKVNKKVVDNQLEILRGINTSTNSGQTSTQSNIMISKSSRKATTNMKSKTMPVTSKLSLTTITRSPKLTLLTSNIPDFTTNIRQLQNTTKSKILTNILTTFTTTIDRTDKLKTDPLQKQPELKTTAQELDVHFVMKITNRPTIIDQLLSSVTSSTRSQNNTISNKQSQTVFTSTIASDNFDKVINNKHVTKFKVLSSTILTPTTKNSINNAKMSLSTLTTHKVTLKPMTKSTAFPNFDHKSSSSLPPFKNIVINNTIQNESTSNYFGSNTSTEEYVTKHELVKNKLKTTKIYDEVNEKIKHEETDAPAIDEITNSDNEKATTASIQVSEDSHQSTLSSIQEVHPLQQVTTDSNTLTTSNNYDENHSSTMLAEFATPKSSDEDLVYNNTSQVGHDQTDSYGNLDLVTERNLQNEENSTTNNNELDIVTLSNSNVSITNYYDNETSEIEDLNEVDEKEDEIRIEDVITVKSNDSVIPEIIDNSTNIVQPEIIATLKPKFKSTLPSDINANVIDPDKPDPTDAIDNKIEASTKITPVIYPTMPMSTRPAILSSTTESDSFVISVNPLTPKLITRYIKTTTMLMSHNTIKNQPLFIAPEKVPIEPTALSNPVTPAPKLPSFYVELRVRMTNVDVCDHKKVFKLKTLLASLLEQDSKVAKVDYKQIVYRPKDVLCQTSSSETTYGRRHKRYSEKSINIFVEDNNGNYSYELTNQLAQALEQTGLKAFQGSVFQDKVIQINSHGKENSSPVVEAKTTSISTGIIIGIVVVIVVVAILIGFVALKVYIRWNRRGVKKMRHISQSARPSTVDPSNLTDAIQLQAFVRMESGRFSRKRMERGSFAYVNTGLELLEQKGHTSNPLTFIGLAEMLKELQDINDEFLMLPNQLATINDMPPGMDENNRYSNVIPNPETRVPLHSLSARDVKQEVDYMNANFIRGYLCYPNCYIATQAPLENTVYDFWRMVWQQNSSVIVMLTALEEQGVEKCVEYWPNTEGGDTTRVFGEYRISQERRIVMPEWIQTTLLLKYKKAKQEKEIQHFWLTSWPKTGLPDYRTLLKFMVQVRPIMDESAGPPVIHCSPGTGRTGVVIALDICMLSFEDSSTVNVLNTVHQLRKDRGGMVQTKEQYAFIYKVIFEYAKMLNNPASSVRSSISSTASGLQQV